MASGTAFADPPRAGLPKWVPYALAATAVVVIGLVAALIFVLADSPTTSAPVAAPTLIVVDADDVVLGRDVASIAARLPSPRRRNAPPHHRFPRRGIGVVNSAVDIYDIPDGVGNVIGVLGRDRRVSLVEPCRDGWCHVCIPEMPGGTGWVWGEFLTF